MFSKGSTATLVEARYDQTVSTSTRHDAHGHSHDGACHEFCGSHGDCHSDGRCARLARRGREGMETLSALLSALVEDAMNMMNKGAGGATRFVKGRGPSGTLLLWYVVLWAVWHIVPAVPGLALKGATVLVDKLLRRQRRARP